MCHQEYNKDSENWLKLLNRIKYLEEKVKQLEERTRTVFRVGDTVQNTDTNEVGVVTKVYSDCVEVEITTSETWDLDEVTLKED